MVYRLYDLLLLLAALFLIPYYLLLRRLGRKSRQGLRERLGLFPDRRLAPLIGRKVIWVHAVSVGETRAAIPLFKAIKTAWPDHALLVSNVTETGHSVAAAIPEIDLCLFFPFDHSLVVSKVLDRVRPQGVVFVETEIWPNFIRAAAQRGIPLLLVNGRISDRSFPRYQRARFLLAPLLQSFSFCGMQSLEDVSRLLRLGAPEDRTCMTGNLKFDVPATAIPTESLEQLRKRFRLPAAVPIWVAGSTHAGEEEAVVAAHRLLLASGSDLRLVLVPRHPERQPAVAATLVQGGFTPRLRSRLRTADPVLAREEVLLVDTLGEMLALYGAADVVFVGGSLVPVGGHNILEACLMQRPVIFGPHMHNFRDISRIVLDAQAGVQIDTASDLAPAIGRWLGDQSQALAAGTAGASLMQHHRGATVRSVALLRQALGEG